MPAIVRSMMHQEVVVVGSMRRRRRPGWWSAPRHGGRLPCQAGGRRLPPSTDVPSRRSHRFGFRGRPMESAAERGLWLPFGYPSARVHRLERVACEHVSARRMEAGILARTTLPPGAVEDAARVITTPKCDSAAMTDGRGRPTGPQPVPSASTNPAPRADAQAGRKALAFDGKHHSEDESGRPSL